MLPATTMHTRNRTIAEDRAAASRVYQQAIRLRNQRAQALLSLRTRYRLLSRTHGDAAILAMRAGHREAAWRATLSAAHYGRLALGDTDLIAVRG